MKLMRKLGIEYVDTISRTVGVNWVARVRGKLTALTIGWTPRGSAPVAVRREQVGLAMVNMVGSNIPAGAVSILGLSPLHGPKLQVYAYAVVENLITQCLKSHIQKV